MEKLILKYRAFQSALGTLSEALDLPFTVIVRDASIQRFEYTFESGWKTLSLYLKEREGIVAQSPKSCIREAFGNGLMTEDEASQFLRMVDDRNLTSHTYMEAVAQSLYAKLPEYLHLMKQLAATLDRRLSPSGDQIPIPS